MIALGEEVRIVDLRDFDVHVDTIGEGARELFGVGLDLFASAGAFVRRISEIAARARVHGGDKHEVGRISGFGVSARDGNLFVFERLAKSLENRTGELGNLVEEENAEVGERDFSGRSLSAATNDGDRRSGVVRGAERTLCDDSVCRLAGKRIDFSDGNHFGRGEGREEVSSGAGEKGLAGARRARDKDVVVAGNSDRKSALGKGLAADVVEDGAVFVCFDIFYNGFGSRSDKSLALEMEEKLAEVFNADEFDAGEKGSLREVLKGEIYLGDAGGLGGFDDVDDAVDRAEIAVERELADEKTILEIGLMELTREGEDGEGDWQVEIGAIL